LPTSGSKYHVERSKFARATPHKATTRKFNVIIMLNGWICLHGVLD